MRCYSRPYHPPYLITNWCTQDAHKRRNTYSLPNQLTVCLCPPGGLCGAVWQTEGLRLQLLVALHQDGFRRGRTRGGQPHHRSVPCTEVNQPPPPPPPPPPLLFPTSSFCLVPLLSLSKDAPDPSETTCRLLQIWLSSKGLSREKLPRPSVSKQRRVKKNK